MNRIMTHRIGRPLIAAFATVAMLTAGGALARGKKKSKTPPPRPAAAKKAAKAAPPAVSAASAVVAVAAVSVGTPTDAELLEAETVAVQPVLGVGAGANGAWYDLANYAKVAKVNKAEAKVALATAISMPKVVEKGFGFAGASSAKDMRVLHYAVGLGFLFTRMQLGATAKAKSTAALLKKHESALTDLTPATRAAVTSLLKGATAGKKAAANGKFFLSTSLRAGVRGVAAGPQRAHGYFLAGVWAGGALLYASMGGNDTYANMAEPIAVMLDKDASFGGSDRVLAKHLRAIAKELKAKKPSARAVGQQILAMQKVTADSK